ncbi:PLD nuclease N-terminal domain-containing protein [Anaerobaca lacustris]|uniref:PLD nuclease N-terminal domain-containing protein n=1 Tax=Anaerobaca lacustris TaxID=3044600 RepID=A0AAW6TZ80_9BACT|nr:PLD nuclease N-terminal domain-containing protein [Sedimentisphaerales bacterium M17dextr]
MATVLWGILIAYLLFWAALLIGCLRRREFCPLFLDSRRTRLFWLATFVFVNPLLTLLYLIFGRMRSPQARPVRLVRDLVLVLAILGFFVNIPGLTHLWMQPFLGRASVADRPAEAHLAVIEASNNTNTFSSTSSGDNSRLACRHMAVIVEGDHPLLHRIGAKLTERLGEIPAVETVELHRDGAFPTDGRRAPDVFVRLVVGNLKETALPYSLKLSAEIGAEIGRAPLHSTHYYQDTHTPPRLNFSLRIEMRHTSSTTGYESVRYTMAAGNIAKDLGEQIAKTLGQWRDKHGLLPELPDDFYGSYGANELPEPLKALAPVPLCSYSGLLTHNETFYQFALAGEVVETIKDMRDAMVASGWKELTSDLESSSINLRFRKDDRQMQIFQLRRREPSRGTVVRTTSSRENSTTLFGVADVLHFGYDERRAVLDGLLVAPVSMERLMLFERMFDKEQQERWLDILEEQPPRDALTQIRLAEMYEHRDRKEQAAAALVRAKALLWAARDDSTLKGRIKRLAKKLGDESLIDDPPAPGDFRDAGFVEVLPGETVELEAGIDEPMVVFCFDGEGEPVVSAVTVRRSDNEDDRFIVEHFQRQKHGSGWGSHGGFGVHGGPWQGLVRQSRQNVSVVWKIGQIATQERFTMNVAIEER